MQAKNTGATYLYGRNPLTEAILFSKRKGVMPIEELFLTKGAEATSEVMSLVQSNKLTYSIITAAEIENLVGRDVVHQGVLARLTAKALYTSLAEVLENASKKERPLFILLDELQDPHNVGAIIRSSVAFGADAILIPEHDQTQITGTVIKTSAGTTFSIPIVRIGNVNTTLISLKEKGFWAYGLTGEGDTSLHTVSFDSPSIIVIGSEGAGIAKKTLEHCDFKLSIPMNPLCESLNASNAAAVTLYEWSKQNKA
jgi:23S rRNA (guanosine2251-2'-O)-methyltransferase